MALVPIRIDRTSKPPIGTPLRSDGHWAVQGWISVWAFNEFAGKRLVGSRPSEYASTTGSPTWMADKCKVSLIADAWRTNTTLLALSSSLSVIMGFIPTASGVNGARFVSNADTASGESFKLSQSTSGSLNPVMAFYTYSVYVYDTAVMDNDKYVVFCGTYGDGFMRLFRDGALRNSVAKSGTLGYRYNPVSFGAAIGGTVGDPSCLYDFVIISSQCFTPEQVASLSANPWQIYEPETVWVEVGGAATRNLVAAIAAISSSSPVLSTLSRRLVSSIIGQATTSYAQATILRSILAAVSGSSETSTIAATISRVLLASVAGASFSSNVTVTLSGIISLVASIPAQSMSSTSRAIIDRAFTSIISGQSDTPSISALIQSLIALVASIPGQSTTPAVAATTARLLLAAINGGSVTASSRAVIDRTLAAVISGQSNVPDIAAMLTNMVSLAAGISAQSTTPAAMATLQRDMMAAIHTATITGAISAATSRAMSAVIEGQSLTPDNIMATLAGLGLVLDTSIESRTIVRTLQSLTKKYTIHSI